MLRFKDIISEKLADDDFKKLYQKECHICAKTLQVIAEMEARHDADALLEELAIGSDDYAALKQGDRCVPKMVIRLCRALDLDTGRIEKQCLRLKKETG